METTELPLEQPLTMPKMLNSLEEQQQEAVALKKALEWELSLDSRDLRSHAWYHGSLPRQRAEEIVQKEGDFLIRDCASQPDNYVLTCHSKGNVLHFVINKILLQPETVYERVQYQFEDEAFDAVPDLITFYVGSGTPISAASGARIQYPCNRYYPLSFYGHKIVGNHLHTQLLAGLRGANTLKSPVGSVDEATDKQALLSSPPKLPSKKQFATTLTPAQAMVITKLKQTEENLLNNGKSLHTNGFQTIARCNNPIEPMDQFKFTTHSLPRSAANVLRNGISNLRLNGALSRTNTLSCSFEERPAAEHNEAAPSPPPKPANAAQLAYRGSGSDSGNGSGDSLPTDLTAEQTLHRGVIIKNPRFMSTSASTATLKSPNECNEQAVEEQLFALKLPEFTAKSSFDYENYNTLLLPVMDNKPLDGDALNTFKVMLLETGPRVVAEHLTRIDIGLLIGDLPSKEADAAEDLNIFDFCGLELLSLPQGKLLRDDLIERTQCIKLIVAVTILTCHTDSDRAQLLSRWIDIALETKTALGNLFGFCAIMLGLCMPQVQKLDQAGHLLRQSYTESAFTFEAKLRPTLTSMNECSNPQAPTTTVPHVLPYCMLRDRALADVLNVGCSNENHSLYNVCITTWETKADDFGMTINFLHLDSIRNFLQNLSIFRKNSKLLLDESSSRLDELLSDAFRTEFHVKFLWGSIGAQASADDRHTKLEKVLALMADKFANLEQKSVT